jgi:hypothetical protein
MQGSTVSRGPGLSGDDKGGRNRWSRRDERTFSETSSFFISSPSISMLFALYTFYTSYINYISYIFYTLGMVRDAVRAQKLTCGAPKYDI